MEPVGLQHRAGSGRSSKAVTWWRYSLPLLALVAQEEVEDVLAEGLGDQLAALHDGDGLVQVLRQRLDAQRAALGRR